MILRKGLAFAGSAALLAGLVSVGAQATSAASAEPLTSIGEISTGAPMNMFNSSPLSWPGLDSMPLAWYNPAGKPTDLKDYYPALAQKWTTSDHGRVVTVTLRSNAKWSNGQPVTTTDVKDTMAILFATGLAQADALGSVQVLSPKVIRLTEATGNTFNLFENSILTSSMIAPASVFGSLLPKNIWTTIATSQYSGTNAAEAAAAKTAQATLTALGKRIAAYAPKQDVASGPFVIQSVNPGEAILAKNPYFYDASGISVPEVILRNYTGNQQIWAYMTSGQVNQATSGGMTTAFVNQTKKVAGNVFYTLPGGDSNSLVFNEHDTPFNNLKVRQAFAYLLNVPEIQKIGEPVSGSINPYSDGLGLSETQEYLTKAQIAKLNKYSYNPTKAAQLLTSAGLKKVGGKWMLPDGKPFTLTMPTVSGFSDWIAANSAIVSELNSFGISAQAQIVSSYAQYLQNQSYGQYPLSMYFISLGFLPYGEFYRLYGVNDGWNLVGGKLSYKAATVKEGGNWIDFPQSVTVSGVGAMNVGAITNDLNTVTNNSVMNKDVQDLAMATNAEVPEITLWDTLQTGFVNEKDYTDFPLKNFAVMMTADGYYPPIGVWMDLGYLKPK
jgi:peptide/nickel transport system substrate-binding protein